MVEPILMAAIQISSLLAQSFFMGFSLTILALLARLRVLVQQILLDIVSVFNMVSALSLKEQSIKLTHEGIEVFREYHPPSGEILTLECKWEGDKFVLSEGTSKSETKNQDGEGNAIPPGSSAIQYQRIDVSNEDELGSEMISMDDSIEELSSPIGTNRQTTGASVDQSVKNDHYPLDGHMDGGRSIHNNSDAEGGSKVTNLSLCSSPNSPKTQTESRNKVAFIPVRKSSESGMSETRPHKRKKIDLLSNTASDNEDPFFSLLTSGITKDSLF
ncbi:uncharacterized protein LOC143889813 [Tasmannia lanceolata]|uniref:uncharacterized protein LOC143889813 n=1 Tax=Tasmannia lanceolata TaxID=3420 RepID=UPI004063F114